MRVSERRESSRSSGLLVVGICFFTVILDGYDLVVFGAVLPAILQEPGWGLTPATIGTVASLALVGMVVGALASAPLADTLGRRKVIMISIVVFSVFTGLCALAPSPALLGLFRLLGGVGLGLLVPAAAALTNEYAPRGRENLFNAVMMSGYASGGVVAAVVAIVLLPVGGWRLMFAVGALPVVIALPLVYLMLPESIRYLVHTGRRAEAERTAARFGVPATALDEMAQSRPVSRSAPVSLLFSGRYLPATLLFAAASFCGLLLIFAMNTGLPAIMQKAGYNTGSSLQFLLAFSFGGIVGVLGASLLADRFGPKIVTATGLVAAAVAITVLSRPLDVGVLLVAVAVAGLGTSGTTILINGYVVTYYPHLSRASALSWVMTTGRLGSVAAPVLIGAILGSGLGFEFSFYVVAAVAALAAVLIVAVPRVAPLPATTATTGAAAVAVPSGAER